MKILFAEVVSFLNVHSFSTQISRWQGWYLLTGSRTVHVYWWMVRYITIICTTVCPMILHTYSTRKNFCGVWKSTVQHDIPALIQHCENLGVKGRHHSDGWSCTVLTSFFSDYELFSLMVTGRTLRTHKDRFYSSALTKRDVRKITKTFTTHMDDVVNILHALPSAMMIVFRSGLSSSPEHG